MKESDSTYGKRYTPERMGVAASTDWKYRGRKYCSDALGQHV
jgi:hypothetical protein